MDQHLPLQPWPHEHHLPRAHLSPNQRPVSQPKLQLLLQCAPQHLQVLC